MLFVLLKSQLESAFPKSDGNLFDWAGTIEGPTETVSFIYLPAFCCSWADVD